VDVESVRQKVLSAVAQAGYPNAKIYFHITRGSGRRDHLPAPDTAPNFLMTVSESTHPDWRWKRCDIKSLNLLANVLARIEAQKKGSGEAILVDDGGMITEGAGSAFFAIDGKEKVIITRPLGHEILPSITRVKVMQVAHNAGISVVEKALTPHQAAECDEMFIAVTTQDIVPVVQFDGARINDGRCGLITQQLMDEFQEFVRANV
jgi:D-alanine transaminase